MNYALLFSGGESHDANRIEYYLNLKRLYGVLISRYGLDPRNIYVIYADGNGDGQDMSFAAGSPMYSAKNENLRRALVDELCLRVDSDDDGVVYHAHRVEQV